MAFDPSSFDDNDITRDLREKHERLLQEKNVLEERKQKAQELFQNLEAKSHETRALEEELMQLANQDISFSDKSGGLRHVGSQAENGLPKDFEGLTIKDENKTDTARHEFVTRLIANLESKINSRDEDIKQIKNQMTEQVEKRPDTVPRGYGADRSQNGTIDQLNLVKTEDDDISLSPSSKLRELENINELCNKRIEELLESSHELQNHINVLTKQKEELLQVNHQWDDQYRQLKADKERLASELRKKAGQTREVAAVQRQGPDANEQATMIRELQQKNAELGQEVASLAEDKKKRDQLWTAAKKMMSEERAAREAATQMKQAAENHIKQLEAQLEVEKQTEAFLKQEIERLATAGGSNNSANNSPMVSLGVTEQIEMLKQQLSVYADDFANERSDRERIQADRETQKEVIKEHEREINLLKEQLRAYRDDFDKERRDKERLQRHLRERSSVQDQGGDQWYMVPPADYVTMHPVARRQERPYRYTPREVQELAFHQQQPLHGRGHPGGLCRGCEPDCDVIDGPVVLKCPRCERIFAERRAFEEHIDKCTT